MNILNSSIEIVNILGEKVTVQNDLIQITPLLAMKAMFVVMLVFGIGDVLSTFTKAKLSSVFVSLILFLLLYMTNIIPHATPEIKNMDIITIAGLTEIGKWAAPFLIFHMGTMINIKEFIKEWKTVLLALISMVVAGVGIFALMPILGREMVLVSIPIINGGIVATKVMSEAAISLGTDVGANAAAMGALLYAIQKFVGSPIASYVGLKEAKKVIEEYRKTGVNPFKDNKKVEEKNNKITFAKKYDKYYGNFVCFTIVAFFSYISYILQNLTNGQISNTIWVLLLGIITCSLGIVPEKILDRSKASGLLNMAVFAAIIPSLGKVTPDKLISLSVNMILIFVVTIVALYIFMAIIPIWKINGSKNVTIGIAVCQLIGFPATYLISNEIINAVATTDEEKEIVNELIMPRYVIAGIATVTSFSVIAAGIFQQILLK